MKRFLAILVLAAGLSAAGLCARADVVDGIVATVGTEVILHSELVEEIMPFLSDLQKKTSDADEFNRQAQSQLRQALDQAVDNKILLRESLLAGLEVKGDAVEIRLGDIKKRFASNEDFLKEIEKAGMTMSDLRDRVRKQILAVSMRMRKHQQFEKEAQVSEADTAAYYKANPDKFAHAERVQARRIFLAAGQDEQEQGQVRARLEELKKQIDGGADFAELAKTYSSGPEAAQGGLVGWVTRSGDLVPHLEEALFALPEGGVTDVLRTEFGLVLMKVEKKEGAGTGSLDEARKVIEPELRAKIAEEKYAKWIGEMRKRSRVRIFLSS